MERRAVLVLVGSVLAVVFGQDQCGDQRKCVPFNECSEYQSYFDKPPSTWPRNVLNEIIQSKCGTEQRATGKIYKFCCKWKTGRALLDLETCGRQSEDRIVHGEVAKVFQFPWMALLGDLNRNFYCGGSLIAESFVLTAGHCGKQKVFFVRVGETDLSTKIDCNTVQGEEDCAEPYQDIPTTRFIRHPNYTSSKRKNDIALVKLSRPAKMNGNVKPICLPFPEMMPKNFPSRMRVSGWGFTEDHKATSNQLRFANVPIVQQSQCNQTISRLHDVYTIDESRVCAGGGADGADSCKGDSGGPLQYFGKKGYVIHGVVSWGLAACGEGSAPGVYTKVSHYLDWIIDNLK